MCLFHLVCFIEFSPRASAPLPWAMRTSGWVRPVPRPVYVGRAEQCAAPGSGKVGRLQLRALAEKPQSWLDSLFSVTRAVSPWASQAALVKNLTANARDRHRRHRFDPGLGEIPWRRAWQPTPVLLPGGPHGQRSLVGYSPWGCKEQDTTEAAKHVYMLNRWPCPPETSVQQCSLPRALRHGFGYLGLRGGDGRGQGYREVSTRPESSWTSLMSPHSPQGSWARAAARLSVMRGQVGIQAGSMALQERNATQKLFPSAACQACACKPPQPASDCPPEQRRAGPPCPAPSAAWLQLFKPTLCVF